MKAEDLGTAGGSQSPAESAAFKDLQAQFSRSAFDAVIQRSVAFEQKYPRSALRGQVLNLRGLSQLLTRRHPAAIQSFRLALQAGAANPVFNQYVLYNLARAQFDGGLIADAMTTASDIRPETMDRENRLKVHYLRANIHLKTGVPGEAAREALLASRLMPELSTGTGGPAATKDARASFVNVLEQGLDEAKNPELTGQLYQEFEDSPIADTLLIRMGQQELEAGNRERGREMLQTLIKRFPSSAYYSRASDILRRFETSGIVAKGTIGALIPMKGKYARFGERSLKGIELALGIFSPTGASTPTGATVSGASADTGSDITLVIEDSGEEPEQAVQALRRLVNQHHVAAVIGPLTSKGIDQVAQEATVLGVPLVSLAKYSGSSRSDWVFQAGLTLRLQAEEVARFAIEQLGLKRFAILHPRDKSGEEISRDFWDAVEALGGQITGYETYPAEETDFRQYVDKLSGLYYTDARARETQALARERETQNIKKRTRKTEQFFALKPVVDYDAVFIPEEAKISGQILPTFTYRDVDHIRFLGTSAWDTPELRTRAQASAEGVIFVDAFFPGSASPAVVQYRDRYKGTYNEDPTVLDALAYDAAELVKRALSSGATSRDEVRDRLHEVKGYSGVTGRIAYREGQFARDLKVLTVRSGQIVEFGAK